MSDLSLEVSIDDQRLRLLDHGRIVRQYPVSTAAKGVGFTEGSHRTPTGRFVISEMIGHGSPPGTIFKKRIPVGQWDGCPCDQDLILTRILRLDGLDPVNSNSLSRYIYLHGTNQEEKLGTPASCGCVRMSNADIIALFELVTPGTPVNILPPTRPRGKLAFFDCDSTLSSIEGIDELARARGPEVFAEVEALTHAAMNGEVPIHEVFPRRMEIIRPDRKLCAQVADLYLATITPGSAGLISSLRRRGWTPVILSGGFAPLIEPLARHLGIDHVEAVPLHFADDGSYSDYGRDYPATRNGGKPEIIREWRKALLPEQIIMTGDGISDLETASEVDLFIAYTGVIDRPVVRSGAGAWIAHMDEFEGVVLPLIEA